MIYMLTKQRGLILASLALMLAPASQAIAQLSVGLSPSSHIVMCGTGEELVGIDLQSDLGYLVPGSDADAGPFAFVLSNTANHIAYGILGETVRLEGAIELPAGWHAEQHDEFPDALQYDFGDAVPNLGPNSDPTNLALPNRGPLLIPPGAAASHTACTIPEPSAAALLACGMIALVRFRRQAS